MKNFFSNDWLNLICRLLFGLMFVYASLDKIANPGEFARIINNYHIMPGSLVNLFALILSMSELLAGLFLIFGLFFEGSRNYLIFLMVIFIIAIGINVVRGVNLECGCFTVSSKAKGNSLDLIYRDILMLLPGMYLLFSKSRRWMVDRVLGLTGG